MPPALPPSRRRRTPALAILAAAALCACPLASAVEPNIYLAPSLWLPSMSGNGNTADGVPAGNFDWDSTLGLDTHKSERTFDGFLRLGVSRFILGYEDGHYNGKKTLERNLDYGSLTFPAGGKVDTSLDVTRRRYLYGRALLNGKRLALGFVAGLDDYSVDTKLELPRPAGPGSEKVRLDAKVPVLGATILFNPTSHVRIYGQVAGMSIDRAGVKSKVVSSYGVIEYSLVSDILAISLGYRYSVLDGNKPGDGVEFNIVQRGTYTGLAIRL